MADEQLCACENFGWPSCPFRCPIHPKCTNDTGCLDYRCPWGPPHMVERHRDCEYCAEGGGRDEKRE